MENVIYIHIGTRKTGSTSIQRFLEHNRDVLAAQGFFLPKLGSTNHIRLVTEIIKNQEYAKRSKWGKVFEAFGESGCKAAVISSENFDALSIEEIGRLQRIFGGCHVKLIVYVRRQDLLLQSIYNERTKIGANRRSFEKFKRVALTNEKFLNRLDFDRLLSPWRHVFGIENITLRPMEAAQLTGGNLCADFLAALKVPDSAAFLGTATANVSPSLKTLEVLRFLRRQVGRGLNNREWRRVFANPVLEFSNARGWNDEKCQLLLFEEAKAIVNTFSESNALVARDYLDRPGGPLFYEAPEPLPLSSFAPSELSEQEILDLDEHVRKVSPKAETAVLRKLLKWIRVKRGVSTNPTSSLL